MIDGHNMDAYDALVKMVCARVARESTGQPGWLVHDTVRAMQTWRDSIEGRMWMLGWTMYAYRGEHWDGLLLREEQGTHVDVCRGRYFVEHILEHMVQARSCGMYEWLTRTGDTRAFGRAAPDAGPVWGDAHGGPDDVP